MNALVTGCAGFIGSHLTESLLQGGATVRGIDCFTDYYSRARKEANCAGFWKVIDFRDDNLLTCDLPELLADIDVVYHLAAQAGVRASWGRQFSIYLDNNIAATQRLLEAARELDRTPRVIFASSSSVYGDALYGAGNSLAQPLDETCLCRPLSPYGVSKLAAENLCYLYWKTHAIPTVSLRFFTVYGPRQRPDMGFSKFFTAAANATPVQIFGDGQQTRDFTYVGDIVTGIIAAGERGIPGRVYNLGGDRRLALNDVLALIETVTGKTLLRDIQAQADGDMRHTWADISRAQADLGFAPRVSLPEGLQRQWAWQQQNSEEGAP